MAILAIGYAIYSNNSFSQNITKLDKASDNIELTSKILTNITSELNNKIESIPPLLENIGKKTDDTHLLIKNLNIKAQVEVQGQPKQLIDINEQAIDNLVYKNSINGSLILLGLKLAYENKIQFNRVDFLNKTEINSDYGHGFLIAIGSLALFKYQEVNNGENYDWIVTDLNRNIESKIEEAIKKLEDEYSSQEYMDFILISIKKVRDYFKEKTTTTNIL